MTVSKMSWQRGIGLGLGAALVFTGAAGAAVASTKIDYTRDIRPIFAEHCILCHGPDDAEGGLRLTHRALAAGALKSGARGIVPGDADASEIVRRILSEDPDERMPPPGKAEALSVEQVAKLRQWIEEGADWPVHWAYGPLGAVLPPAVKDAARVVNEIDRFVQAGLEAKGIEPSTEADRHTLIKRLSYDLIGLPPGVEEVDAFVNDPEANAYEKVVDRLLASPHFGERWGRHWLDKARYADSDGYEKDRNRPNAWRYRDWVIRAINEDLPFDQFTIQQLAGDLASSDEEARLATAFNRQTLTNTEGGTDKEQWRVAAVMDRTETLGSVWLGLTVGCARCHTHKYDAITQKEYYELFAYFNNGDETNTEVARSEIEMAKHKRAKAAHDARVDALQKEIDGLAAKLKPAQETWAKEYAESLESKATALTFHGLKDAVVSGTGKFDALEDGSFRGKGEPPDKATYFVKGRSSLRNVTALKLEALPDKALPKSGPGRADNGNFVLTHLELLAGKTGKLEARKHGVKLIDAMEDFQQGKFPAATALDSNARTGWAVGGGVGRPHEAVYRLAKPLNFEGEYRLQIKLDQQYGGKHTLGRFRVTLATGDASGVVPLALKKALAVDPAKRSADQRNMVAERFHAARSPEMVGLRKRMAALKKAEPKSPMMSVRVISQRTKDPRQTHTFRRGEFKQPMDPVGTGTFSTLPDVIEREAGKGDRLDLARWLVDGRNPLVPRVAVNHIWANLFGEGIVRTINDFGVRGDRPTHPELLNWLAWRYVDLAWSRKAMIKTIVMSATYRQSSRHRPELADLDPNNELLYQQNRFRVEAEILRDISLAASGLLSRKVGGPSVFPPIPKSATDVNYNSAFKWQTSPGGDKHRRGMYTFFKRTAPHPNLTTFDCPDSNVTCVKRTRSNTPIGALVTLNNEVYLEAARAMAARTLAKDADSDAARLTRAFRTCVARPPSGAELKRLQTLLKASREWYGDPSRAEDAGKAVGGHAVSGVAPAENAAWVATLRIILNLDEFITRE